MLWGAYTWSFWEEEKTLSTFCCPVRPSEPQQSALLAVTWQYWLVPLAENLVESLWNHVQKDTREPWTQVRLMWVFFFTVTVPRIWSKGWCRTAWPGTSLCLKRHRFELGWKTRPAAGDFPCNGIPTIHHPHPCSSSPSGHTWLQPQGGESLQVTLPGQGLLSRTEPPQGNIPEAGSCSQEERGGLCPGKEEESREMKPCNGLFLSAVLGKHGKAAPIPGGRWTWTLFQQGARRWKGKGAAAETTGAMGAGESGGEMKTRGSGCWGRQKQSGLYFLSFETWVFFSVSSIFGNSNEQRDASEKLKVVEHRPAHSSFLVTDPVCTSRRVFTTSTIQGNTQHTHCLCLLGFVVLTTFCCWSHVNWPFESKMSTLQYQVGLTHGLHTRKALLTAPRLKMVHVVHFCFRKLKEELPVSAKQIQSIALLPSSDHCLIIFWREMTANSHETVNINWPCWFLYPSL